MTLQPMIFVATAIVSGLASSCGPARVATQAQTPLEMRLASREIQPDWKIMPVKGTSDSIYVSPEITLSNGDIQVAEVGHGPGGQAWVTIQLTPSGTRKFAEFTSGHIGSPMATLVSGEVISVPTIRAEIPNGRAIIAGRFTEKEAQELAGSLVPRK